MTGIDLDQMRSRWQQQSTRVDAKLTLDVDAVRATLAARSTSAFRKHTRWLLAALCGDTIALLALGAFIFNHSHDWMYLLVEMSLALLVLAESITDLHEWRAIKRLDSSAPLMSVQDTFDDLRARRLHMMRWILLLSVLMWWPLLALFFKGLIGVDLLRALHWRVAVVNSVAGLVFIALAAPVANWLSRRYAGSPAFQRMLDDMAGRSFDAARQSVQSRARFESDLVDGASDDTVAAHLRTPIWPDAARAPLRTLRLRLLLGILFYATLLIATGLFNASHGGMAQFIVPGVLLNFLWVALMASGIEQRVRLSRIAVSPSLAVAIESLMKIAAWRTTIVGYVLVATPLLSLALVQVMAKQLIGVDVWTTVGSVGASMAAVLATALSLTMLNGQRRAPELFAPTLVDALCFGAIRATRKLIAALGHPKA